MSDHEDVDGAYISLQFERDRLMRSQIIYESIALEGAVDRLLACHFCPDDSKHDLFVSVLFGDGEVTFSRKIRMLKKVLKLCYPKLATAYAFLPNRLDKLRELRNQFAHLKLDIPMKGIGADLGKAEIKLRAIKDGQKTLHAISEAHITTVVNQCRDLKMAAIFLAIAIRTLSRGENDSELLDDTALLGEQIGKRLAVTTRRPNSR